MMLPVVSYGYEASSLTSRKKGRRRVFENRVLRKIFGPKWDEVRGTWIILYNDELCDLHSLSNVIRLMKSR
jgi:hypothetical protein